MGSLGLSYANDQDLLDPETQGRSRNPGEIIRSKPCSIMFYSLVFIFLQCQTGNYLRGTETEGGGGM